MPLLKGPWGVAHKEQLTAGPYLVSLVPGFATCVVRSRPLDTDYI